MTWYNVDNVDLNDIDCPPFYKSIEGEIGNFAASCLRNEGLVDASGIRVRRAVKKDVLELSYLWKAFVVEEDSNRKPNQDAWVHKTLGMLNDSNYYLLVAEKNGELIGFQDGYVTLDPAINETCVMGKSIYVKPEHRGGEATKKLNGLTMDLGKRAGVTTIMRPIRPELLDYWQKKGCKLVNMVVRTNYVGG